MTDSIPSTPDQSGEPTPFPSYAPETCVACGGPFGAFESRLYWSSPAHWMVRQHLGPIHSRCQRFDNAQEDALRKVLSSSSLAPSGESGVPRWERGEIGRDGVGRCCESSHSPADTACRNYEQGANGRCVLCDHEEKCHPGPGATCWIGSGESADSTPPVSSPEKPEPDFFDLWNAKPCDICGGPRNYRVSGQLQVICFYCAVPAAELRKRLDDLLPSSSLPTDEEVERLDVCRCGHKFDQHNAHGCYVMLNDGEVLRECRCDYPEATLYRRAFASLHRDLDEARKEIDHATQIAKAALDDGSTDVQFHTVGEWMAALWRSRNLWKDAADHAERERVEYRESVASLIAEENRLRDVMRAMEERLTTRAESFRVAANAVGERNEELERRLATAERERDEARKGREHFPNCPAHPDIAQCVCDLIASRSIHPTQTD